MMKSALIVEDEFIVALDIQRILKSIGFGKIAICADAKEALNKIVEEDVDLITLDILLRGRKTGIDVAKEIKAISHAKIYFICGNHPSVFSKNFNDVSDGFTLKPFIESEVIRMVNAKPNNAAYF